MTRAGLVGVTILAVCWPHAGHGQSRENAGVPATAAPVVVASKPFGESYILAEMFSQLLESRGIAVERRAGLGATEIAFGALRVNAIDVYPEYTGTGLLAILQDTLDVAMRTDARATFAYVARVFEERYGVRWLAPLGFENGYAIARRRRGTNSERSRTWRASVANSRPGSRPTLSAVRTDSMDSLASTASDSKPCDRSRRR